MPPRNKADRQLQRTHVHLYKSDVDRIHELFGNNVGYSTAIRTMVSQYISRIDAEQTKKSKSIPSLELEEIAEGA